MGKKKIRPWEIEDDETEKYEKKVVKDGTMGHDVNELSRIMRRIRGDVKRTSR